MSKVFKKGQGVPKKLKFKDVFEVDGIKTTWTYDLKKNPHGPMSVDIQYSRNYKSDAELIEEENKKLPKTKRKYWNPDSDSYVSYARAKQLKLV